jgi:hypothetical protein
MVNISCSSCGGDGIKKPLEALKSHKGALKRCLVCWGTGLTGRKPRQCTQGRWYSVRFTTSAGDVIRVTTKGKDESEARMKARRLLDPSLHCQMG